MKRTKKEVKNISPDIFLTLLPLFVYFVLFVIFVSSSWPIYMGY